MSEDIKVQIELDKLTAERSLRELSQQLMGADKLIAQLKRSGVTWADDFTDSVSKVKEQIKSMGNAVAAATNQAIKENDKFAKSFNNVFSKVEKVKASLESFSKNFYIPINASKLPATASLRDDDEKRRQQYFSNIQKQYLKEQASLQKHLSKMREIGIQNATKVSATASLRNEDDARRQKYFASIQKQYQKEQASLIKHNERLIQEEVNAMKKREQAITASFNRIFAQREKFQSKSIGQLAKNTLNVSGSAAVASLGGKAAVQALKAQQTAATSSVELANKQIDAAMRQRERLIIASFNRIKAAREKQATDEIKDRTKMYTELFILADRYRSNSIKQLAKDIPNASGLRATAPLGGQKAANDLLRHNTELNRQAAMEDKKRNAVLNEVAKNQARLADSGRRLTTVSLSQAGAANKLSSAWRLAKQEIKETASIANIVQSSMRGLLGFFANFGYELVNVIRHAPTVASEMLGFRNALALVTGDQREASKLLNTSINIAERLKLSIASVTKEYSKFTNAATVSGMSIEQATKTFEDFAIAARVLNLTPERTSGMFLALEQMVSKGTVSMEELRRQLGEHIPGAVPLAAQAMGYATDEIGDFIKAVSTGKVQSNELVKSLGDLLRKRTEPQLAQSLLKFSATLTNVENAFTKLSIKLGDGLSQILNPLLDTVAYLVNAFSDWLPASSILSDEQERLSSSLDTVLGNATALNDAVDTSVSILDRLEKASASSSTSLAGMSTEFNNASVAAVGLLGVVGTAGLGGAFIALSKAANVVKAGLLAFLAPFSKIFQFLTKLAPIAAFIGAWKTLVATVTGAITALRAYAVIAQMIAITNPFTATLTAITAVAGVVRSLIDSAEDFDNEVARSETSFREATTEANKLQATLKAAADQMFKFGQNDIAVSLTKGSDKLSKIDNHINALNDGNAYLKDQHTWWDSIAESVGITTDHAELLKTRISENNNAIDIFKGIAKDVNNEMEGMITKSSEIAANLKKLGQHFDEYLANEDIREVQLEIKLLESGASDLDREIARIKEEMTNDITKAVREAEKTGFAPSENLIARIRQLADLKIKEAELRDQIKSRDEAQKNALQTMKKTISDFDSYEEALSSSILTLKRKNDEIGLSSQKIQELNYAYEIQKLNEDLLVLKSQATTTALKQRVVVLQQQIEALSELQKQNLALTLAEEVRQQSLKDQDEATKKLIDRQKEGNELLKGTLTLQQQYALRVQEILPALEAVGASQQQIKKVMQKEWAEIVDSSNTGLKSMQAITEEVAKGMHQGFEDFFFEAMKGNLADLETTFNDTLRRMIASEMASKFTNFLMTGGSGLASGNGFLSSAINTIAVGLGGVGKAPSVGATMAMGGGYVSLPTLHSGGLGIEGVPRYHSGIGPREEAAIIRKDEGVFTPGQMASMATLNQVRDAGGNMTYSPSINVSISGDDPSIAQKVKAAVKQQMSDSMYEFAALNKMRLSSSQQGARISASSNAGRRNA